MKVFCCSTCFECYYIHPQELATVCGCTALFGCVLVYWCGSAGVGWYPTAGWCITYSGRTAPLISKRCILYIYSTNIGTEYFKHGIYCPFFSSSKCSLFHNSVVFGSCVIHILNTGVVKLKKIIPAPKG
jgi:hypothetical protein